jgi:hypothetical protein|tara:strand:- start:202 stop:468 length:267 start_codon:yes stop_codon:yes gene_type:complete
MGTENHNVVSFNTNTLLKGGHGVIVAIYCTKEDAGAKLEVINGITAAGTVEFEVYGASIQSVFNINRRLEEGIFMKVTNAAEWVAVFK